MRSSSWGTRREAQTHQMTCVAEQSPDFSSNGCIVAVVAPAPTHSSSSARGFQGLEGFRREERAAMHAGEQQQDIAGQVSERSISLLIFPPTLLDLSAVKGESFLIPGAFGMVNGQRVSFLLISVHLLLQLVNLSAGSPLLSSQPGGVQDTAP